MGTDKQFNSDIGSDSGREPIGLPEFGRDGSRRRSHLAALEDGQIRARLLHGFLRHERHAILSTASYRQFTRDSVIVNQGDPADRLFLLIKGSARFFFLTPDGKKVYLHWLARGEIFGGASLLTDPATFLVSTEVSAGSQVLVWMRDVVHSLATIYPRLSENALSIANDFLVWFLASHLSLICNTARERLANVLVSLADGIGQQCPGGVRIDVTNEQLANTANITVFTASRLLREFQRSGAIMKSRGNILVCNPQRLFPKNGNLQIATG